MCSKKTNSFLLNCLKSVPTLKKAMKKLMKKTLKKAEDIELRRGKQLFKTSTLMTYKF